MDLRWRLRRQRWRPLARASQSVIDEFLQFDLTTICFFLQHVLDHFHFGRSHLKMLAVCNEFLGKTFFNIGKTSSTCTSIWMFPKIVGFPPNHPLKNRGFHYFHHLFLGCFPPIFGFPPIYFPLPSLLHFFDFSVEPPVLEDLVLALRFAAEFQVQQMPQVKRFQPKGWPISRENWGRQLEEMGPCFF